MDTFDIFATKIMALGRAFRLKGGRETVKFMLDRKGAATRTEIQEAVGIDKYDAFQIVTALKDGGILEVPAGRGSIMYLSPNIKAALAAMARPIAPAPVTEVRRGKMVAKFTRFLPEDPIVEGSCGPYLFTATMSSEPVGAWETGAEHFVMRDSETGAPVAKHDPEQGWTKRPNSPKRVAHLELIEQLFKNAPKKY